MDLRGGGTPSFSLVRTSGKEAKFAFTLAEVLITLGIVGVVASLTLPNLIANYKRQEMIGRLKKTYTVLSQAFVMSENENGIFADWNASTGTQYFDIYWKKYIKGISECTTRGCGYESLTKGGEYVWRNLNGTVRQTGVYPSRSRHSALLADGTFVMFIVRTETVEQAYVNYILVDINGHKKPNTLGKDVFWLEVTERGVVPFGLEYSDEYIKSNCSKTEQGERCAAWLYRNGWNVPDDYPLK